jgi:dipeptidyl aminopeptidase/acylaminoacyl peptidase
VKPADLTLLRLPGTPSLTPDGRTAVVALQRLDLEADGYTSQLWLVDVAGEVEPRQLTYGWRDGSPRVSPDGRWVAFTRAVRENAGSRAGSAGNGKADAEDKPQLCVLPLAGGEPVRLTDHPLGVGAPVWHPDSTRLAYAARVPETGRYGTGRDALDEKVPADGEPPRRVTRLFYRIDDLGYTFDQPRQLFVVGLDGAPPVPVTEGEYDNDDPAWSPDGEWLTFVSARHESYDNDLANDVWIVRPDGSAARALSDTSLYASQPRFVPDGSAVVFTGVRVGDDRMHAMGQNEVPWSVPVEGTGQTPRPLLDEERHNLAAPGGQIAVTDKGVLFPDEYRGSVRLLRVPFDGGDPVVVLDGQRQADSVGVAADMLVARVTSPSTWGDLVLCGQDERPLTDWSGEFRDSVSVHAQEELTATAPDGYPVHGWVVRPTGPGPHPVLLMIHGGPQSQYGWRLFDEAQVYAGAGYAVVMGNPRGSSGYGRAHARSIIGNVGEISAVDLLALLDAALEAPDLDASRVGVLGGSHGGYMTTWLAAHHGSRFRAAVSERAVNAPDSFTGSSDVGWCFADDLYGSDPAQQAVQAPLAYADRIDVPMLIIHSEQDWRCPVEQAQRLFVALKRRGARVEMLLFPGEGHEMSRSGRPSHRVARFDAILDWFGRWM